MKRCCGDWARSGVQESVLDGFVLTPIVTAINNFLVLLN
jgi:hypothetical protein